MSLISKAIKAGLLAKAASYAYDKYMEKKHPVKTAYRKSWFGRHTQHKAEYGFQEAANDLMTIVQKLRRG